VELPYFGIAVPQALPGVDSGILNPQDTYTDSSEWDSKAQNLAGMFVENFQRFTDSDAGKALVAAGPKT
ncbi:MAG: phosphoenolpyruvate carboxykinase (ATP), partial [Gammaproteobacteria bacterium]